MSSRIKSRKCEHSSPYVQILNRPSSKNVSGLESLNSMYWFCTESECISVTKSEDRSGAGGSDGGWRMWSVALQQCQRSEEPILALHQGIFSDPVFEEFGFRSILSFPTHVMNSTSICPEI
jgi:hypothetical protein